MMQQNDITDNHPIDTAKKNTNSTLFDKKQNPHDLARQEEDALIERFMAVMQLPSNWKSFDNKDIVQKIAILASIFPKKSEEELDVVLQDLKKAQIYRTEREQWRAKVFEEVEKHFSTYAISILVIKNEFFFHLNSIQLRLL